MALTVALSPLRAEAAPTEISTCGQSIRGSAVLVADLECAGLIALTIDRGKLDMNGFTITGAGVGPAVLCSDRCSISGPGAITGGGSGIDAKGKLKLTGVDVVGNNFIGVQCFDSCKIRGPAAISNKGHGPSTQAWHGVTAAKVAKVREVTIENNRGVGVKATSFFSHNGRVVCGTRLSGTISTGSWPIAPSGSATV